MGLAVWIRKGSGRQSQFFSSVRAWGEIFTRHENTSLQKSKGFDVYCCLDTASAATFYVDSFLIGWHVSTQGELNLSSRLFIITTKSDKQLCRSDLSSDAEHLELWLLSWGKENHVEQWYLHNMVKIRQSHSHHKHRHLFKHSQILFKQPMMEEQCMMGRLQVCFDSKPLQWTGSSGSELVWQPFP